MSKYRLILNFKAAEEITILSALTLIEKKFLDVLEEEDIKKLGVEVCHTELVEVRSSAEIFNGCIRVVE
jgi:hypothetical protein